MREFRPGNFQILPPVIKNLIIINVLVFLAHHPFAPTAGSQTIENIFALHTWQSPLFKPWQFVTHLFMHGSWAHILSNMFALWMFGSVLENVWGAKRFLIFYFICGLGAAFCHMLVLYFETNGLLNNYYALSKHFDVSSFSDFFSKENIGNYYYGASDLLHQWQLNPSNATAAHESMMLTNRFITDRLNEATLGASGAIFGCLIAFGYLFPNTLIYLYFFLPLKAKWFVLIYAGFELMMALQNSAGDNVAHVAHLGGALFGLLLVIFWNKNNRRTFY
jgi:membrane associated rhomboid family serine protease